MKNLVCFEHYKKKGVLRILSSFNINFQHIRNFSKFLEEVFKKVKITLKLKLNFGIFRSSKNKNK